VVKLDLPPEPRSATRAREVTREHLATCCPPEAIEVAALLVTELVTNAILHARTAIVVAVEATPGRVVLRVSDGSETKPAVRDFGPDASTGRGIWLVEQLATTWGVERSAAGKEVWCEIDFPPLTSDRTVEANGGLR
jgi:anti-sigma regulatory factor (Ser/Thr protein kinase)